MVSLYYNDTIHTLATYGGCLVLLLWPSRLAIKHVFAEWKL